MNKIKEKLYSASEVAGRELRNNDRTFSESEVEEFSELFSEFNDMYGDQYDNIDDAYSEFFDAYSNVKMEKDETTRDEGNIKSPHHNKIYGRGAAGAVGAGAGYGIASLLNKKDQIKRAKILKDMSVGRATSADIAELEVLKKKMNKRKAIGVVAGGATGVGLAMGAHHAFKDKNNSGEDSEADQTNNKNKNNMANNANEDQFSDEFAEYYMKNIDTYGDSEQGMEDAYNDFTSTDEDGDDEYADENDAEVEGQEGDQYSEEEMNSHIDAFSDFYTEMEDVYGDSDAGMEEAYADFLELNSTLESDDTYSEDDFSEEELQFIEFYADTEDIYGDNLEEAYADFIELAAEDSGDEYGDEDAEGETEGDEDAEGEADATYSTEDFYGDAETFVEDFADFYAEMEDVYGDDVATAFDDYADALEGMAEEAYAELAQGQVEDEYTEVEGENEDAEGDDEYSTKTAVKGAAIGAAAGAGLGYGTSKLASYLGKKNIPKRRAELKALEVKAAEYKKAGKDTYKIEGRIAKLKNVIEIAERHQRHGNTAAKSAATKLGVAGAAIGGLTNYSEDDANVEGQDSEYAFSDAKEKGQKFFKGTGKSAAVGAGIGAVGGLAIGAATDPNSKTRKALKAKQKAGTITASEQAQLKQLKSDRRSRLLKATGAGVAAGAVAGVASQKTGLNDKVADSKAGKKVTEVAGKASTAVKDAKDKVVNKFKKSETEVKTTPAGADRYPKGTDAELPKDKKYSYVNSLITGKTSKHVEQTAVDTNNSDKELVKDSNVEDKTFSFKGNKSEKSSYVLDILTKK